MIHRAIFGSLERFFGIMTENYAGDFPFWLAPEQIRLLPVSDDMRPWAESLQQHLRQAGIRSSIDSYGERLAKLIRRGETMKIPVLAVIGAREAEAGGANLRSRSQGDLGLTAAADLVEAAATANRQRLATLPLPSAGQDG